MACKKNIKNFFDFNKKRISFFVILFILFSISPALAKASLYAPGETLNPNCLPTDENCDVRFFSASSPIDYSTSTGIFSISQASSTSDGFLSSSDWSIFNTAYSWGNHADAGYLLATVAPTLYAQISGQTFTGDIFAANFNGTSTGVNTGDETQSSIKSKLGSASTNTDGYLNAFDWNLFNSKQDAGNYLSIETDPVFGASQAINITSDDITNLSNLSGINSGDVSLGTANGLSILGQVLSLDVATANTTGALTDTDWNIFNNKQNAIATGTSNQYLRGDLSLATFPTALSSFSNDTNYITLSSIVGLYQEAGTAVTSVGAGDGLSSSGGLTPTISIASGYYLPLTADQTSWNNKVSSQWTSSSSDIFYNAGNVGIGADATFGGMVNLPNGYSINTNGYFNGYSNGADYARNNLGTFFTGNGYSLDAGANNFIVDTNTLWVDATNHRVNIGTENPLESFTGYGKLNVRGDVHIYSASDTYKSYGFFLQPAPYNGDSTLSAWGTTILAGKNTATGRLTSQIKFEAGTGIMRFSTGLTTPTERMTILEGGNVGIGTTTPSRKLHISGIGWEATPKTGDLLITGTGLYGPTIGLQSTDTGGHLWNLFSTGSSGLVGAGAFTIRDDTDAQYRMVIDKDGNFAFGEAITDAALTGAKMVIKNTGNVGVGITTPTGLLGMPATSSNTPRIRFQNTTTSGLDAGISTYNATTGNLGINLGIGTNLYIDSGGTYQAFNTSYPSAGLDVSRLGVVRYYSATSGTPTERMRLLADGKLGIGTTAPLGNLDVSDGNITLVLGAENGLKTRTDSTVKYARVAFPHYLSAEEPAAFFLSQAGSGNNTIYFGGGSSSMNAATEIRFYTAANNTTVTGTERLRIDNAGNIGVGTTTPSTTLDVWGSLNIATSSTPTLLADTSTGGIRLGFLTGAGANLVVDANGNVTVSSDERLKNIVNTFERGLSDVLKINPILFKWKGETGYDTENTYAGFSAQNMQNAIPEAVSTSSSGYLTLADRPILAAVINSIKQIGSIFVKIEKGIVYIKEIVVDKFTAKEVHTEKLCVDDVCVDKDQLKAILINAGGTTNTGTSTGQVVSDDPVADTSTSSSATSTLATSTPDTNASTTIPLTPPDISTTTPKEVPEETKDTSSSTEPVVEQVIDVEPVAEEPVSNDSVSTTTVSN